MPATSALVTKRPSRLAFIISLILVVLAVVSVFVRIPVISQYSFWVAVIGYVILALATLIRERRYPNERR